MTMDIIKVKRNTFEFVVAYVSAPEGSCKARGKADQGGSRRPRMHPAQDYKADSK